MNEISTWLLLVLTLPTENATARMRFWRALKAKGCAVLRDGIYLLPYTEAHEGTLRELAAAIAESGGTAHLLRAPSLDASQEMEFSALFDRGEDYASLTQALADARKTLAGQSASDLARLLRRLRKDYEAIRAIDYFPGDSATRAEVAWQDFIALVGTVLSPGEPHAAERDIRSLAVDAYQGRTWATRQRMWVDRVASAWPIRRFIDVRARFIWLASPADCPADALGFDFDGAAFTHVGERVTLVITVGFIGYLVAGVPGACIAALGTFLPCYLFTIIPAPYVKKYGHRTDVKAFVNGITAAAVGAITGSVLVIAKRSIVDTPTAVLAVTTVLLLWRFKKLQEPVIVTAAALLGRVAYPLLHH